MFIQSHPYYCIYSHVNYVSSISIQLYSLSVMFIQRHSSSFIFTHVHSSSLNFIRHHASSLIFIHLHSPASIFIRVHSLCGMGRYGDHGRDGAETIYEIRASKQTTSKNQDMEMKVHCRYALVSGVEKCRNLVWAPHNDGLTGLTD